MKAGREHIVPLSAETIAIFEKAKPLKRLNSNLVFPGSGVGKPLSDMTLTKVLRDLGRTETVHGFRSTFRDWVAEQTNFPAGIAEVALVHVNSDKTEAAYLRTDMREQRRQLMCEWGEFCVAQH